MTPTHLTAVVERITRELTAVVDAEVKRRLDAIKREWKRASVAPPAKRRASNRLETLIARPPEEPQRKPARVSKSRGYALDMECRVVGCGRLSRGPRLGYICDLHREELTPAQQLFAREQHKARKRGDAGHPPPPQQALSTPSAIEVPSASTAVELVEAPSSALPLAPVGSDYLLRIEKVKLVGLKKLGPTLELKFIVAKGPHVGSVVRGQFPIAGRGLPILGEAALGAQLDVSEPDAFLRLAGKTVLADVAHAGSANTLLAIVRNIRSAEAHTV